MVSDWIRSRVLCLRRGATSSSYLSELTSDPFAFRLCFVYLLFFFFQAEDGIRDLTVTGVQTCALPIWGSSGSTFFRYRNCGLLRFFKTTSNRPSWSKSPRANVRLSSKKSSPQIPETSEKVPSRLFM